MDNGASSYRRFLDGDESAFDEIISEYRSGLTFFINRFVSDAFAAEDIAADVLVELIVHPKRYDFRTSLKTYLFMLGRSRAIDYVRRRKRVEMTELDFELAGDDEVEKKVLDDERKRSLNDAMTSLNEEMRIAVHLVYLEGLSYKEAAKIMRKSTKQIDNLLFRAKKELRSMLGGELL
ncbi:MAG: RNA polymerase sigma factor [Clostridia bacterium]|nr:RNA polymerase sigma factor [Clostridia bacterium]